MKGSVMDTEKPREMTRREKLAMLSHWAEGLKQENAEWEAARVAVVRFDPDFAFETIRLRKGRRPADDATTAGDAGSGRTLARRRVRQGTPSLRSLGRRYEIIFRACEVVRRKEKLFNYHDPTFPARVASLHAARQALFERLNGTAPRRRD